MSNNKRYAVHEGRNPGIYDSWPQAKAQVDGHPGNCYEKVQPSGEPYSKPYIVYDGATPGVYDQWRDAHAQVSGYHGANYERARSFPEAETKFQSSQGHGSSKKGHY